MGKLSRRAVLASGAGAYVASNVFFAPRSAYAQSVDPVVETISGNVRGQRIDNCLVFKGIQYGDSYANGLLRFKPSDPPLPWRGARDAFEYGATAWQTPPAPSRGLLGSGGGGPAMDESCLFLNVWTPALDNARRPVMVWLHGGGFQTGSGSSPWYDGTNQALKNDVVVVTINHRLNAFGYLYLGDIAGEEYKDSGNVGMTDCIRALTWVRDHIERFGGDPNRVMIFGESGGGRKTSVLMAMPGAQQLFHRCVVQSGSALRMNTPAHATELTLQIMRQLGYGDGEWERLLEVEPAALVAAHQTIAGVEQGVQVRPVVDGRALTQHPFDPIQPRMSSHVPMLIGTNRTEQSIFLGGLPGMTSLDDAGLARHAARWVPADRAESVIAAYRGWFAGDSNADLLYRIATDRSYFLDSTIQAALKGDHGGAPAYMYNMNWTTPVDGGRWRSPHALEIPFVFDNLAKAPSMVGEVTPQAQALADLMSKAWANFARTGNPNTRGLPRWGSYTSRQRRAMQFDAPRSTVVTDPRRAQRELMLEIGSQQLT